MSCRKIIIRMKQSSVNDDTTNRRSTRVRRSLVETNALPEGESEQEPSRKKPTGRCKNKRRKCIEEQEQQFPEHPLVTAGHEMPPGETRDGVPAVEPIKETRDGLPVSQSGERKITTLDTIAEDGNESGSEENGKATEVHPLKKKRDACKRKSARNLLVVDEEMPPAETNNVLSAAEPPPHPEEEKPKLDLLFLLEPARKPKDWQHLMNAASVLKSQLVARLTGNADKLSTEDMIILADQCYNTLRKLGDNSNCFKTEVNKLIAQHRELSLAAEKKETLNGRDREKRYVQQAELLCDATNKLASAQYTLLRMKSDAASLKLKIEELTSESLKLKKELSKERERVMLLTAERDECKEAIAAVESELGKLDTEKEVARLAFEAINARYYADKKEFEKMSNQLLRSVSK